jgi:hypothetical protein
VALVWVESISPSFRARHDVRATDDADRLLHGLERIRGRLERTFPRIPQGVTVVLHGGPLGLAFTNPLLPLRWALTEPTSRRYVAGWASTGELHVLAPAALESWSSPAQGSREMLASVPAALYARRVIVGNHATLRAARSHRRLAHEMRFAWLLEGGARWFAGQTEHSGPTIARRLRQGSEFAFPPALRDAALLGPTVIDFLAAAYGADAAATFLCRFDFERSDASLLSAFGVRSFRKLERAWRDHVYSLAAAS